jgi:adenosylcobinamide kinase / adenosylcobinamide-phosphate guanylyltransferase
MDVRFLGTGGRDGWPEPGCPCASCRRAAAAGPGRRGVSLLVDGRLRLDPGQPPRGAAPGYQVGELPGGWDITGPDGARALVAGAPGAVPEPGRITRAYDLVVLDLLAFPAQLGSLRSRGLARAGGTAAFLSADHRVGSERELARRAGLWRAIAPADGDVLSTAPEPGPGEPGTREPEAREPGAREAGQGEPAWRPQRTLVLGGARSGKSREAELELAGEPDVTYLAAGPWPDDAWTGADGQPDPEWAQRVAAHQARRPPWWQTVESTDVAGALRRLDGAVLIDGIGTWLAAVMDQAGAWDPGPGGEKAADRLAEQVDDLVTAWRETRARVVAVSDQVGSGLVPGTPAGRQFRDQLGWLNQRLAAESEQALLVVAGRVLDLPT